VPSYERGSLLVRAAIVLNASRHHRYLHTVLCNQLLLNPMCSTPRGITGTFMCARCMQAMYARAVANPGSTPRGITDTFMREACDVMTPLLLCSTPRGITGTFIRVLPAGSALEPGAQRLAASQVPS